MLYAVKGAVEKAGEGDAAPLFAEELKKIEFANDEQKKEAMNAAFVSVCSTGVKKEVDLMLAQVRDLSLNKIIQCGNRKGTHHHAFMH